MLGKRFSLTGCFWVINLMVLFISTVFPAGSWAAKFGEFSGTWLANGTREVFLFGEERKVYTFKLSGHVNLKTIIGEKTDYWSECVGFSDSETGTVARCVWRDLDGPELFIRLKGEQLETGSWVTGTIIGGSGDLKGIKGSLSFRWSSVSLQDDATESTITGQALNLGGSYQTP